MKWKAVWYSYKKKKKISSRHWTGRNASWFDGNIKNKKSRFHLQMKWIKIIFFQAFLFSFQQVCISSFFHQCKFWMLQLLPCPPLMTNFAKSKNGLIRKVVVRSCGYVITWTKKKKNKKKKQWKFLPLYPLRRTTWKACCSLMQIFFFFFLMWISRLW